MFIIEKFISDYRKSVKDWEEARDEWVNDPKYANRYRDVITYERNHPRPTNWLVVIGRSIAIGVCVGLLGVLIIGFGKEIVVSDKNQPQDTVVQSDKNCESFNRGDKVRIQYGNYAGNVGTIIGGCEADEAYQVKIDAGSKANMPNDNSPEPIDVSGRTISVDSKKNLVQINEPSAEEKKE